MRDGVARPESGGPPALTAVIFDVGGVLLLPSGERIARAVEAATRVAVDPVRARDGWTRAIADIDLSFADSADLTRYRILRPEDGALSDLEERWMGHAGVPAEQVPEAVVALRKENSKRRSLWEEAVEGGRAALDALLAAGLRLGCVSNSDGRVEQELEEDGLRDPFEVVIDSHVVGVPKPSRRIFEICLERMGNLEPGDCLYVGDTVSFDIVGAADAGLVPCHFDRLRLYGGPGDGFARVSRLSDLVAVAKGGGGQPP